MRRTNRGVQFTLPVAGKKQRARRPARRGPQGQQVIVVQQPSRFGLRRPAPTQQQVPVVPFDDWAEKVKPDGGSTWHRNRPQIYPWIIPLILLACSAVLQGVVWFGVDRASLAGIVAIVGGLAALIAARVGAGRLKPRWRARVYGWAIAGWTWLITTVPHRLTWTMVGVLILITVAITSRWWADHRPGYPTRPARPKPRTGDEEGGDVPPADDDIVGNFNRYARCPGGPAEGCSLTDADVNDARATFTFNIRPGKDSLNKLLQRQDTLATAVRHDPEDLIIEKHPTKKATLRFTVVTHSPVTDTVPFAEPGWREDGHDAWIEAGTWVDGEGRVPIPVLAKNSARNLAILAPMGGGKSSILNVLTIGALSSGRATIWYLDGKGGASSPTLTVYSDWAPGGIHEPQIRARGRDVLGALEKLAEQRRVQQMIDGVSGLNPTSDLPLVIVVLDECHVFLDPTDKVTVARWNKLVRLLRALGICVWAATQYPNVNSFGGDSFIKEALMGHTTILGRFTTGVAKGLLNTEFDPKQLPDDGGYFFLDSKKGRSAMWRGDYLDDEASEAGARDSAADDWFKRYANRPLERRALATMPTAYTRRAEIAEAQRRQLLEPDTDLPLADEVGDEGVDGPAPTGGGWQPNWPNLHVVTPAVETPRRPQGLTERGAQVWAEVAGGRGTPREIGAALELGKSQVHALLKQLVDADHIRWAGKGRYELPQA